MPGMKGKWAQGIQPRNFAWVIQDRLAVCERPGGYAANHRRVRRQEEIIWIREQGFTCVVSLIPSPHNLHNYDLDKALREVERVGHNKYICVESYRNEQEKANLLYWQVTCESFCTPEEWDWWFRLTGYTGDYSFIYFE